MRGEVDLRTLPLHVGLTLTLRHEAWEGPGTITGTITRLTPHEFHFRVTETWGRGPRKAGWNVIQADSPYAGTLFSRRRDTLAGWWVSTGEPRVEWVYAEEIR